MLIPTHADPVFVVTACLAIGSPPALTLAQVCESRFMDTFGILANITRSDYGRGVRRCIRATYFENNVMGLCCGVCTFGLLALETLVCP